MILYDNMEQVLLVTEDILPLPDNVQMWENEGQFGSYIKLRVTEALAPGDYFVSVKKGHVSKVTN